MSLENLVWEQKYRPSLVEDCILPIDTKELIKNSMATGKLPNMLFTGAAGTGKTTLARAISTELDCDLLFINASLEGNIDTLRTSISQFVSTVSFSDSKKIVLLDEADYLNAQSTMPALRGFMDEFSSNATFILTANFPHRLIQPLLSRLTVINFKFSKEERQGAAISMLKRCCQILDIEAIKFDKKAVAAVVSKNFPDFRKTLGELQRYATSGEIDSGIVGLSEESTISELIESIKNKDFTKCRQWIANNQMDSATFYRSLYDKMLPELVPATIPQIILHINNSQDQSTRSIDLEINQTAAIINIMSTAKFK